MTKNELNNALIERKEKEAKEKAKRQRKQKRHQPYEYKGYDLKSPLVVPIFALYLFFKKIHDRIFKFNEKTTIKIIDETLKQRGYFDNDGNYRFEYYTITPCFKFFVKSPFLRSYCKANKYEIYEYMLYKYNLEGYKQQKVYDYGGNTSIVFYKINEEKA